MEGEKDFDEEPIEALVSRLIKRGDTYKGIPIKVSLKS